MVIAAVTFVVVLALVFGAYWFLIGAPEVREQQSLRRRLRTEDPLLIRKGVTAGLLKQETALSDIGFLNASLKAAGTAVGPLQNFIENSGLSLTVGSFLLLSGVCCLGAGLLANAFLPVIWVSLVAALIGLLVPYWVVGFFKTRRTNMFEEQFPEAIELIARAMRAGHAFTTGIKIAADELPAPSGPEFRLLFERQNYGAPLPDALRSFAERVPTIDARFFVTAVLTQREAGGNLSEILDRLAGVMRERFKIRREVRTKSAHGRITAFVLAALPPVLAVLITLINPQQMRILTTDPMGINFIIAGVVLQVGGVLLVRKIIDIQY